LLRCRRVKMFQVLVVFVLLHDERNGRLRGVFWVDASKSPSAKWIDSDYVERAMCTVGEGILEVYVAVALD
jgi:hypothetical protein